MGLSFVGLPVVLRLTGKFEYIGGKKKDGPISVSTEISIQTGRMSNIIGGCMSLIWNMNEIFQMVKAEMKCWILLLSYLLLSAACLKG